MDDISRYIDRPLAFVARYARQRPISHAAIVTTVVAAVICAVGTQYGVKLLVDTLSGGISGAHAGAVWMVFVLLVSLIAADNLLWRLACWIASYAFVGVTGDLRRDLFSYLTGHAPSYFADRMPGTLTSRITATSNAVYTLQSMFAWQVLPQCVSTLVAIVLLSMVSVTMALSVAAIAAVLILLLSRMAAAGKHLHHAFAHRAAAVDGEMIDVVGNLSLVWAFCGRRREHSRLDASIGDELVARRHSLQYLEKLRLFHAVVTVLLTAALVAWGVSLWQSGSVTAGDVVLVCTLGLSILHTTRDLAVALVEVTQHLARLTEALSTLLSPYHLRDHPEAGPLVQSGSRIVFDKVSFSYPDGRKVFTDFDLKIESGQRVGLVGASGCGKSTLFALLQRFYDVQGGRILVGGQDVAHVTQESLRSIISTVPQDVSLFHRSIRENIRYGRPEASDEEVLDAMRAAHCEFIEHLPAGLETIVGDRGVKLSPGQRQRIGIARAFLKDAPILLLDEATSALDSESEDAVREALDDLMQGRTVLAIAHRLSTLRSFDRVVVLKSGTIKEDGAPDALMRGEGLYRGLVEKELAKLAIQPA